MRLFSDQKDLLLRTFKDSGNTLGPAQADEAIATAYRDIAGLNWTYLHRHTQINTNPAYQTGTIGYNATTNVLTLTGGTWPSWAYQGLLIIQSNIYQVMNILSSTTVSLLPGRAPVVDIPSGTAFILVQAEYLLPVNFREMEDFVTVANFWQTYEMEPGSLAQALRMFYNPARPWMFTVRGSTYSPGRMCVEFAPPPDIAYTFEVVYFAWPRQRTLPDKASGGLVSCTGTAVTGSNTAFTQSMVGCQLRFGKTSSAPPNGEYGTLGSTNEATIQTVQSATALTLLSPAPQNVSGVQYVIDDPVDVERMSMDEVFCRMCEKHYLLLTRATDRVVAAKDDQVAMALRVARARDVRTSPKPRRHVYPSFSALAFANLHGH